MRWPVLSGSTNRKPLFMPKVSIFIPAYNAEKHLARVIGRIPEASWADIVSVWIVNDGSRDATADVMEQLAGQNPKIRLLSLAENSGYGTAVKNGLAAVKKESPDYAICLHADGQYPPEHIPHFTAQAAEKNFDILQGSRMAPGTARQGGMPLYKYLAGRILTAMENFVYGLSLTDYHSGYLCYSKRALENLPFENFSSSFDFDLEVIACARKKGMKIGEIGIPTQYADEISYLNPVTYGLRVVGVMGKYVSGKYS